MARPKNPKGRPPKYSKPEPIPDTAENITRSLLRTRSKKDRELIAKRAERAAPRPRQTA